MTLDLERLAALESAATPGPWEFGDGLVTPYGADGELYVEARNALPELIASSRRAVELEAENGRLREVAHAAWHLMDESGESDDEYLYTHGSLDHHRLDRALDGLEAFGWSPHPKEDE